jgi:hypothetical protein
MTITVREFAGSRKLKLDADQRYLFLHELRRVKRYLPHRKGVPYRMNPDCTVTLSEKGQRVEYAVFGHSILYEVKKNRRRQFYFGVLLLQWLYK